MSQVVSDPAASNEESKVFANYITYNYRLTLRIATPQVWRTCDSVGFFRCVLHVHMIARYEGTFGDLHVLVHAEKTYIHTHPADCCGSHACHLGSANTEKFLIILPTPQPHMHTCLKCRNCLCCYQICLVLSKHAVSKSINTPVHNLGSPVAYLK